MQRLLFDFCWPPNWLAAGQAGNWYDQLLAYPVEAERGVVLVRPLAAVNYAKHTYFAGSFVRVALAR